MQRIDTPLWIQLVFLALLFIWSPLPVKAQPPIATERPAIQPVPTRGIGPRKIEGKKQILWIGGGHWHDTARYYAILRHHFENEVKESWFCTYTEDTHILTRLDRYDAVVMLHQLDSMTVEEEQALYAWLRNGHRLVTLHAASVAFWWFHREQFQNYLDLFGGEVTGHPPQQNFPVQIADPNHPITRGVEDFVIWDEFYMAKDFKPDNHVILTGIMEGKTLPLAWTRNFGQGELCYIALGHGVEANTLPAYQQLLRNAIHWALGDGH